MRKAERLFQLVLLLRRPRVITARQLAAALRVSERTIYRDIQSLILSGVPIDGEAGVGYILRRSFELPPLMFSREEALALLLGARMVQAWGDPGLQQAAHLLLEKVSQVAPESVRETLADTTLLAPDFHIAPQLRKSLGYVRRCIVERRILEFGYTRADGASSMRKVRPLGLVYWGNAWTLASWCELRRGFRTFRVDRMSEIQAATESFAPEPGKGLEDYLSAVME